MEKRWNNVPKNRRFNATTNVQRHSQFEPSSYANPLKGQPPREIMERRWNNMPKNRQFNATTNVQRHTQFEPSSSANPLKYQPPGAYTINATPQVPIGDSPYQKAKQMQLIHKDPERAIALFWAAINAGDRVDSALKDMAITMMQQNRCEQAIQSIISFRNLCSIEAQENLESILLELYKKCGRLDDHIKLLKHKLSVINQYLTFNEMKTQTAKSGRGKIQVNIKHEMATLLKNLGWAYMQQSDYITAEEQYRNAFSVEPDNSKMCNIAACLIHQGRVAEAKTILQSVNPASSNGSWGDDCQFNSYKTAQGMLRVFEAKTNNSDSLHENSDGGLMPTMPKSLQCPCEPNQCEHEKPNSDSGYSEITTLNATSEFGSSEHDLLLSSDKRSQFSIFDNAWVQNKTVEDGFGDENININNIGSVSASSQGRAISNFPKNSQPLQSNREAFSQQLHKDYLKENASVKHPANFLPLDSSCTEQPSMNRAAAPSVCKYPNDSDRQSICSNGLGPGASFEESVPSKFDPIYEPKKNPFAGKNILGPIGSGRFKNGGKSTSENRKPVPQRKVLGPISNGSLIGI